MKHKTLIAAAALAAASLSAIAADASTLTREEVKAELRDLQAAGLVQPNQEVSATPLDDQRRSQMFTRLYGQDRVAQAIAQRDGLMSLVDRADEAPVVIIEAAPRDEAPQVPTQ